MSSVFTKSRWRRRLLEVVGWAVGLTASLGLATGVYSLAAAPFTTSINDDTALPKELATTTERVQVPLPAVLSPNAAPVPGQPVTIAPAVAQQNAAPSTTVAPAATRTQENGDPPAPANPTAPAASPTAPAPAPQPQARPNNTSAPATQAPRRPTQTQSPQTTPAPTPAPNRNDDNLAPIIDPITGLVRGTSQDQDRSQR